MKSNITDNQRREPSASGVTGADSSRKTTPDTGTALPDVPQLMLLAQRELATARKIRAQAEQYFQETTVKARSEAQRLILQARLTIRKDTEKMMRQANEEIRKVLADIRMIRITAQEELAAQKKFTDAARLRSFTLSLQKDDSDLEDSIGQEPAGKKQSVN